MGNLTERHRPLLAGLKITSSDQGGSGTLTGLATRRADGKRVLVTNLHVMDRDMLNPSRDTRMYQVLRNNDGEEVGRLLDWVTATPRDPNNAEDVTVYNTADVAIVELNPSVEASFGFHGPNHDDSNHGGGIIKVGTKDLGNL